MGWATGSALAEELWRDLKPLIPKDRRPQAADAMVKRFEDYDCDTLDEVTDPDFQDAVRRAHGDEGTFDPDPMKGDWSNR